MADKHVKETDGGNVGDSGLQEHLTHWAEVLDLWIKSIDTRLGRHSGLDELDADSGVEQ